MPLDIELILKHKDNNSFHINIHIKLKEEFINGT